MKNLSVIFLLLLLLPLLGSLSTNASTLLVTEQTNEPIKILNYNIQESGIDPDWKEVVKEENPDIMILIETGDWDEATNDGFGRSDFTSLVTELNSYFPEETPYEAFTAQNIPYDTSGEAIFSRYPVLNFVQLHSLTLDDDSSWTPSHDFIDAEINATGVIIHVIGVHLKCCSGDTNVLKRENAQEGINNYMDSLGDVPILYIGDLNSFSPEDTGTLAPEGDLGYTIIPMLIDPSNPKACEIHTFFDVYRTLNPTDPGYSFGWDSDFLISRIDFIFANSFFVDKFSNSTVGDTESAKVASDHLAIDALLKLNSQTTSEISTTTETTSSVTSQSTSFFFLFQVIAMFTIVLKKKP